MTKKRGTHDLPGGLIPKPDPGNLQILHPPQFNSLLQYLLPIFITPQRARRTILLDHFIPVMMRIAHYFPFLIKDRELMVLHPEDVVWSLGNLLEMQEGAFVMFWPRREWGFGRRVGGGVSGVCHCG
jgi:hypothetical protein